MGYTLLIIELLNVYDKINESYANITIYLHYNSKHVRPTEVKIEVTGIIEYDEQTVKKLRKSLKLFCTTDLQTAFDNILKDDNPQFTWKREKKTNTILLTGVCLISIFLFDLLLTYNKHLNIYRNPAAQIMIR